jgi:hypothetical protein
MKGNALKLLACALFGALSVAQNASAQPLLLHCTAVGGSPQRDLIADITAELDRRVVEVEHLTGWGPESKVGVSNVQVTGTAIRFDETHCAAEDNRGKCEIAYSSTFFIDRKNGSIGVTERGCSGPVCVPETWTGSCIARGQKSR